MARVSPSDASIPSILPAGREEQGTFGVQTQRQASSAMNSRGTSGSSALFASFSRGIQPDPTASGSKGLSRQSPSSLRVSLPSLGKSTSSVTGVSPRHSATLIARRRVRGALTWSGWYESATACSVRRHLRGKVFSSVLMVALFIALFLSDFFILVEVPSNTPQDVLLTFVFALFALEFLGLSFTDASYLLGFFFWMDLLGTCSIVLDVSFVLGTDATEPEKVSESNSAHNVIFLRAARVSKLAARAGRLSRLVKLLRFMPFMFDSATGNQARMAKVISNQLTNVLSTRVAFLNICIVVVETIIALFTFPTSDGSMQAWTQMLEEDCKALYLAKLARPINQTLVALSRDILADELGRFADFYNDKWYGPFSVCCGDTATYGWFSCFPGADALPVDFGPLTDHNEPRRRSLIREVKGDYFLASFDLSTPRQYEALMSIFLIVFIILMMCIFGMVMSSNISVLALQPLERMLDVVRAHCAQIFKYTNDLNQESAGRDEAYDDAEQTSEFLLLEKVVERLTAIADITTAKQTAKDAALMDEDQLMVLNWMQGSNALQPMKKGNSGRSGLSRPTSFRPPSKLGHGTSGSKLGSPTPSEGTADRHSEEASREIDYLLARSPISNVVLQPEVICSLETPFFNALDLNKDAKVALAMWMIFNCEGCSSWVTACIPTHTCFHFIVRIEAGYLPNPFHNFSHGLDVQYTVYRCLRLIDAGIFLGDVGQFSLLLAALAHDVGHTAVNNQYLIETSHELAIKYNDRSPLENMHCAKLFQVLTEPDANLLSGLDRDVYKDIRRTVISTILHTDVTKHNDMVKELNILYEMNTNLFDSNDVLDEELRSVLSDNVTVVCNMLLHGSDVGNPMKPWELCKQYAYLCLDEFFNQGDLEKAAGIPVQVLNDRDKVSRPQSQVGFIEFVIAPLVEVMVSIFPNLDSLAEHLGSNVQSWVQVWQDEAKPAAEALAKVQARAQKVVARCNAVTRAERGLPVPEQ